jgi:UDP-3-O-[3-hydroxymyristoyl] glucosamine N-acyltransferase
MLLQCSGYESPPEYVRTTGNRLISFFIVLFLLTATLLSPIAKAAPGDIDTAYSLNRLSGPIFDNDGNLYIAIQVSGGYQILEIAPDGTQTGLVSPILPNKAIDLAFDSTGNLYATSGTSVLRINNDGSTTVVATGINAASGLAFDSNDDMYIGTATFPGGQLYKVNSSDVSAIDDPGYDPAGKASFQLGLYGALRDLFFDNTSNLLLASSQQSGIYTIDTSTNTTRQLIGGSAIGVTTDAAGNIFYAGFASHAVYTIDAGDVTNVAGALVNTTLVAGIEGNASFTGDGGPATSATLGFPEWVAVSGTDVYVGDRAGASGPTKLRVIEGIATEPAIIDTFANGLGGPRGLLSDSAGNLYVSVAVSGGFQVLRIAPDGTQTSLASLPNRVADLAFDTSGNLYATLQTRAVRLNNDGTSTDVATGITEPSGIAFDANNNLYISRATLSGQTVYRVSSADIAAIDDPGYDAATTAIALAPPGSSFPIGGALRDLFYDQVSGLILVSSQQNGIWSLDPITGAVVQLTAGSSLGVTADAEGNVFYAGFANQAVFSIDASEVTNPARDISNVTVVAGTVGVPGSSGDGGPATAATLGLPEWIAVSGSDVYVAERGPGNAPSTTTIRVIQGAAVAPPPDLDADNDGVPDTADNCPATFNTDQADLDGDDVGDVCDPDIDGDGVDNSADVFPNDPSESADTDMDGVGDNGDAFPNDPTETVDSDLDGVGDNGDAFPNDPNESSDIDMDGVGDNGDNCPIVPNADQTDINADGFGDACVDPNTNIDPDAFGSNPLIDEGVTMGDGSVFGNNADLGAYVTIRRDVTAGDNVFIGANTIVRREATIGDNVEVGTGAILARGSTVGSAATIEANVIVRSGAIVGDQVIVAEGAIVGADASIGDNVNVGEDARVRSGASVGDNVDVGAGSKIRSGATVGSNVQIGANVVIASGVVIGDDVQIGLACPAAISENDPPCVIIRQGSVIAGQNVIGVNVTLRRNVTVPTGTCVDDGTTVSRNTTVDTFCQ